MKRLRTFLAGLVVVLAAAAFVFRPALETGPDARPAHTAALPDDDVKPLPAFVEKGMDWLAQAQFENGGWGAGTHSRQDVRDPHAVQVDPATTAFAAMALIRSGSTLTDGPYRANIRKALDYLLHLVETSPKDNARISDITGTQPQVKLGQQIDVSMVAQFFTQALPLTGHDKALRGRVAEALELLVSKLARAQDADGSWNSRGGWAGVLQSAMANNALELADEAGLEVDKDALERSRTYQKNNVGASGEVRTESAAGISLYSIASSQRAAAKEARQAAQAVAEGARDGRLDAPVVNEANLRKMGYGEDEAKKLIDAHQKYEAAADMLQSEDVLAGFGNNGGEEFLSYMMTSESLATSGGKDWDAWYEKMHTRLAKIQNGDGSWSGHHCITSPVFCTAAVILTMTADRAART